MPRGNTQQTKVIYKGNSDDFIVFIDSIEDLQKWKKDSSVPLAQVLNGWKIFCSDKYVTQFRPFRGINSRLIWYKNNRHGAQGILNEASNSHLENEFGTSREEDVVAKILRGGSPQVGTVSHFLSFIHSFTLFVPINE